MNLEEQLEQDNRIVIEIPFPLSDAVKNIAKDVTPKEYILMAVVNKLKSDILRYRTASQFADENLRAYEEKCQKQTKKELDKTEKR